MQTRMWCVLAVAAVLGVAGCGGKDAGQNATGDTPATQTAGPDASVREFLNACLKGDEDAAVKMLTEVARKKLKEIDLAVTPPGGNKTASFEVGEISFIKAEDGSVGGAHVASKCSDVNDQGERQTEDVVWILRQEGDGWRIAGNVTQPFPDLESLVLNFEDPEDMVRKRNLVAEEFQRREEQKIREAQRVLRDGAGTQLK